MCVALCLSLFEFYILFQVPDCLFDILGAVLVFVPPKIFEGVSQYRPPLNFELVGKKLDLVMDDGYDCTLDFVNRKTLRYGRKDSEPKEYAYDCLKADDDTYFVNFEVTGANPRAGISLILKPSPSQETQ